MNAKVEVPKITRCLRVEIVKPLNVTWDEAGTLLRGQRAVMHRLMNAAVLGYLDDRKLDKEGKAEVSVYLRVGQTLDEFREWARKHKDSGVKRFADIDVGTGIQSAIAQMGADAYQKWRKGKGNERIPSFGKGQPIPVRAQESRLRKEPKGFVLECKLLSGTGAWHQFALAASTGRHYEALRNLAEQKHGYAMAAIKLDYCERKKKWYALLSYSYPRPPSAAECDPDRVMTLHRGVHNFLVAMSSAGHYNVVARGGKLMALKRKLAARRRSMAAIPSGELGTGAKGHGTERRYESREALGDKEARCVKTFCQQTGAKVRLLAKQWGCGRIVIGDYGGIDADEERALRRFVPRFPLYQLKSAIGNALDPLSLNLEEVSEAHVSQTCPRCSNRESGQHNRRTGIFHCTICAFERPADWVSALLMLRTAEPLHNEHDKRLEAQYEVEKKLRDSKSVEVNEAEEKADSTALTRGHERPRIGEAKAEPSLSGGNSQEVHDPPSRSPRQSSARAGERSGAVQKTGTARSPVIMPESETDNAKSAAGAPSKSRLNKGARKPIGKAVKGKGPS